MKLEDIGFSSFFAENLKLNKDEKVSPARVVAVYRKVYVLKNEDFDYSAKVSGKLRFTASSREDYPAVGDWVLATFNDDNTAVIHKVLPRKSVLNRKSVASSEKQVIAANIDYGFIVEAPDRDFNLNRFERYITLLESDKITPILILNKTDLISEDELQEKTADINLRLPHIDIYFTSTYSGSGIEELKKILIPAKTYCFLGSSGVGKTSIINAISGDSFNETGEISSVSNRGRHVTTHRELFITKDGGILIDNPGMREIGVVDSNEGIENLFSDIQELAKKCRYANCSHIHEPGCAVLKEIEEGLLDKNRFDNYQRLEKENSFNSMSKLEKREKNKKLGKFFKKAKKEIEKYKYQ